jgi:predicted metal-dependent phosphotriesterase family hydrolase
VSEAQVMTVTGPLAARRLGVVDAHEHLFIETPAMPGREITDPERVAEELAEARASGVAAVVELTPIGLGRRPALLREASLRTRVAVIAATGYHRDEHYPAAHWVHTATTEELARRIVADLTDGMHPRDWEGESPPDAARAGVIKAGASYQHISPGERRRLEAAAAGSAVCGVAVLVHTEIGTCGHEIIDALEVAGAATDRIVLAHMDRNPDPELHAEIAARGVTLVYDTVGRIKYRPDSTLLDLIERMVAGGHGPRLMLGLDLGGRDAYRAYGGGPGMRSLMTSFAPRLRQRIGDAATDAILIANPARAFAVAGVTAEPQVGARA